jgi:phage tail sheath protein FI
MPEYLTPGVYFEFLDKAPRGIRGLRTDITGFVGLAERGPRHTPVRIESWRQFQAVFGDLVPYSFLAYAVKGFFENAGRTCYIVRVTGHTADKSALTLKTRAGTEILHMDAIHEGTWGDKIAVTLLQVRPSALEFSLMVTWNRRERENFSNLSIRPDQDRYFVRILNEGDERTAPSQWIRVEDLMQARAPRTAESLPDADASGLKNRSGFLSGGKDGIRTLTKDDFLGGLRALENVDEVGIICVPDIHLQPVPAPHTAPPAPAPISDPCKPTPKTLPLPLPKTPSPRENPPVFSEAEIFDVQRAMLEHCEGRKDRVAILEVPLRRSGTVQEVESWREQFDSERGFGALYYPWIKVVDPLTLGGEVVRTIPPCGHIAGLYARSDFTVGVHKAPANGELFWAEDVTVEVNDAMQAILNPKGINCLRAFPGRGIRVYGARTVSSHPDWRYVNVRRLMLMIEESVDESTQWAVFEPHDFNLRQLLTLSISSFLETLWRQGALVGGSAEEAFYVKCDETTNPPEMVDQGKLIAEVGVAPTIPAEFIVFRVGRTLEEFDIVER